MKRIDAEKFIECFSLQKNWNRLFCCEVSKDAVPAVDGFRSIACIIVLTFHSCFFGHFAIENGTTMFSISEQFHWQFIMAAPFYVDAFFTISGFLLTYNFLRNQKRVDEIRCNSFNNNLKLFGKQLLSRYLRYFSACHFSINEPLPLILMFYSIQINTALSSHNTRNYSSNWLLRWIVTILDIRS